MPILQCVVFTRDRHPADHCSFKDHGGTWPTHCVDQTTGFEIHAQLEIPKTARFVDKATTKDKDAYSGFDGTNLAAELKAAKIERTIIAGLATDYCVKATALDSVNAGFETWVATDAIAAVDINPGDGLQALAAMKTAGCHLAEAGLLHTLFTHHLKPTALIIVDVQNDFCEGGALAVPNAKRIFAPLAKLLELMK